MRVYTLAILGILAGSTQLQAHASSTLHELLRPDESTAAAVSQTVSEWVSEGKSLALSILSEARRSPRHQRLASVFDDVARSLSRSEIHWPRPGYEFRECESRDLAYAIVGKPNIYLCRSTTIEDPKFGVLALAQVLIHEAAHVEGYKSECDASAIEVASIAGSGRELAFENGYLAACGLK